MEHEQQQPQHEERGGEQQQRRRQQHQWVDRARAGLRLRSSSELDEREDADGQHDQLDRNAGQQRTILARHGAPLLEDGSRDVGERQQQQDERPDRGGDGAERLRRGIQLNGEQHAGERRSVRPTGEAREPQADQESERERDEGGEHRLDRLRQQERPA